LLKLASYERSLGNDVALVRKKESVPYFKPDKIYITSLWTYEWLPIRKTIRKYRILYPEAKIILGGIYATLMYDHANTLGADYVHKGLFEMAEDLMPAYDLVPDWNASIIFTSRGCIRKCKFCGVHILEGAIKREERTLKSKVYEGHKRIILQDNNILAHKYWKEIFQELKDLNMEVDINSGLDCRLLNEEHIKYLSEIRIPHIRLAYDTWGMGDKVKRSVELLKSVGFTGDDIIIYALYNFEDDPEDFKKRVEEILDLKCGVYPTKYQPIDALSRNAYLGKKWSKEKLRMVNRTTSGTGTFGTIPPIRKTIEQFKNAANFDEAFVRPITYKDEDKYKKLESWA
jgi:hypothetical protein